MKRIEIVTKAIGAIMVGLAANSFMNILVNDIWQAGMNIAARGNYWLGYNYIYAPLAALMIGLFLLAYKFGCDCNKDDIKSQKK